MCKDEFVKTAVSSGYASKDVAEEYSKGRDKFADSDFIEVYRLEQQREDAANNSKFRSINGGKTTKRFGWEEDK